VPQASCDDDLKLRNVKEKENRQKVSVIQR